MGNLSLPMGQAVAGGYARRRQTAWVKDPPCQLSPDAFASVDHQFVGEIEVGEFALEFEGVAVAGLGGFDLVVEEIEGLITMAMGPNICYFAAIKVRFAWQRMHGPNGDGNGAEKSWTKAWAKD